MRELRPRVLARDRSDLIGSPNRKRSTSRWWTAHVGERQPVVILKEALPVRDRVHVDLREDHLAQVAPVEDLLQHRIDWS
jgi:hypothetical protein